jgi:hypothetical protein
MNTPTILTERYLTSALLLLGYLFGFGGCLMYANRIFLGGRFFPGNIPWERGLIGAASVAIWFGFVLLAAALQAAGEHLFSWIGLGTLALGTVLVVVIEWRTILAAQTSGAQVTPGWVGLLIWVFVALTFVGQAAFGVALLQTTLLPPWAGWLVMLWNLTWLAVVIVFSANNPYYPALFYVGPLVLGILLLRP